jgi:hypothetical protein
LGAPAPQPKKGAESLRCCGGPTSFQIPFPARASRYKLRPMLKTLIFCLKLAIVFAGIVLFGRAIQYLIFNGGFSGEFYDYLFMRK